MAATDGQPLRCVPDSQPQNRAHDLAEHRAQVGAGVLRIVDFGAQPGLADGEPAGERRGRHPDVDAELADVVSPVAELQVMADQVAGHAEVAPDRLADLVAIERAG